MDKENIKGAGQKIKGKIEDIAGRILDDEGLNLMEKPISSQASFGTTKDPAKDTVEDAKTI